MLMTGYENWLFFGLFSLRKIQLFLNCPEDELKSVLADTVAERGEVGALTIHSPLPPLTPKSLGANAVKAQATKNHTLSEFAHQQSRLAMNMSDLARLTPDEGSQTPSDYSSLDDDPNTEYARLKLRLDGLTTSKKKTKSASDDTFVRQLRTRLEAVKTHYFFDQKEAEAQYHLERKNAIEANLQLRLRNGEDSPDPTLSVQSPHTTVTTSTPPRTPVPDTDSTDIFEDAEEDGTLFGILDEMPTETVSETGITIHVRAMPLAKTSATRLPTKFLRDAAKKLDNFATVTYRDLSGSSRVKRAAVSVHWGNGKIEDWSMDDVACHDNAEAEQYISTVALHSLTYPTSEGFAGGGTPASSPTFFRLFPPAYRELWEELETKRKGTEESTNRTVWGNLRTIVEQKANGSNKVLLVDFNLTTNTYGDCQLPTKGGRVTLKDEEHDVRRDATSLSSMDSEQLIESFKIRQATPAYQEMLVCAALNATITR
jgi:ATP-dependent RNA helicase DHX29